MDHTPAVVSYSQDFVSLDQEVKDLTAPKPETRWCLLELPKDQLQALTSGSTFAFRELSGSEAGQGYAALSTADSTFRVEFLENSNTLLLGKVEELDKENAGANGANVAGRCTVFAQCRGQLILKPEKPDASKVRELLRPSALGQVLGTPTFYDFLTLQKAVASSSKELVELLRDGPYVEVDGKWRLLPEKLQRQILDTALTIVTAQGWDLKDVDGDALLQEVRQALDNGEDSLPSLAVLRKVLVTVEGEKTAAEVEPQPASCRFHLDQEKVNLFRALQILEEKPQQVREKFDLVPVARPPAKRPRIAGPSPGGNALQLDEFIQVFKDLTSKEVTKDELLKMLALRAYVDEFEGTIHALDASMLPRDPEERLDRLFELQSHWRPERLCSLLTPSLKETKVEAWLLKRVRQVFIELNPGEEVRMMTKKFA
ncbi:unnamed protein product [Effrenium voratum]|nr:unnamed protein product [Effrenium voratum]CAJ1442552.1 unnamed protein product [Effrenium voratum]